MYWFQQEDGKKYFVDDKFVKDPEKYFENGIRHWTHISEDQIIDKYSENTK